MKTESPPAPTPTPTPSPAKKTSSINVKDSVLSVTRRNKDLEKRAFRATSSLAGVSLALIVSVLGNVYQGLNRPEPRYFAHDNTTGTLTPIIGLTTPISSRTAILQHAADSIGALNAIDPLNYRSQLNMAANYFTKNAWVRYLDEFKGTGTLELIERKNMVMTGIVTEPPVITAEGVIFNSLYWDVQVPYRVKYVAQGYNQSVDYVAKIKIVRVPAVDNPKGIAIAQFVSSRSQSQASR